MKKERTVIIFILAMTAFFLSGCATTSRMNDLETELAVKEKENNDLADQINNLEEELAAKDAELSRKVETEKHSEVVPEEEPLLPPNANTGDCFARVWIAPVYETKTETILKKEASEQVEIIPAEYEWVEEKVLVKEASTKLEEVPAEYEWVEEKVLVEDAHTIWKKGRGLVEKVDNNTGEIMCLVEIPAKYKTVRKRIVTQKPTVREVVIPAEYKTIKVKKLVKPATVKRTVIPAEYQEVTKVEKVSEGHMEWRRVLCETNLTRDIVKELQTALLNAGHNPGPIDGIIGWRTMNAVKSYQTEKGLAVGELTYETLESLGIKID